MRSVVICENDVDDEMMRRSTAAVVLIPIRC